MKRSEIIAEYQLKIVEAERNVLEALANRVKYANLCKPTAGLMSNRANMERAKHYDRRVTWNGSMIAKYKEFISKLEK